MPLLTGHGFRELSKAESRFLGPRPESGLVAVFGVLFDALGVGGSERVWKCLGLSPCLSELAAELDWLDAEHVFVSDQLKLEKPW